MSEKITEGFVAALGGGISGLVFAAVVKAVLAPYNALIEIVNIIQSLAGLESMNYWGFSI